MTIMRQSYPDGSGSPRSPLRGIVLSDLCSFRNVCVISSVAFSFSVKVEKAKALRLVKRNGHIQTEPNDIYLNHRQGRPILEMIHLCATLWILHLSHYNPTLCIF